MQVAVDLVTRCVRIHAEPVDGEYRLVTTVLPGTGATLTVPAFPDVVVDVDALFPPA